MIRANCTGRNRLCNRRIVLNQQSRNPISRWWQARSLRLAHARIDPALWAPATTALPLLAGLNQPAQDRLRDLAALFLNYKSLELARDAQLDASTQIELDADGAEKLLKMVDALEDLDDVQEVYNNADIPDAVMAALDN